jgi:Dolichyl-phosphate-mannose-protein mannosyltransferase
VVRRTGKVLNRPEELPPPADSHENILLVSKGFATVRRQPALTDLGLLFGSAVYLYLNLFTNSGIPYLLSGDQVFFWLYAQRLLNGECVYRDFFQFTPPGTDLVFCSLFKIFGTRIEVANWVVLILGVVLCWLCFRLSLFFVRRSAAIAAAALFLVVLFGKMLNATHHWFSTLAVTLAISVLLKTRSARRIVAAGALLGLASFFTQTRGVVAAAGIAVFLLREHFETERSLRTGVTRVGMMVLSFTATWASLSAYWIAVIGLRRLLTFQISAARRYVIHGWTISSLGIPLEDLTWRRFPVGGQYIFVYILLPCVYAICIWKCWTKLFPDRERVLLLSLTGLAMMFEVAQSLNWVRVYCVAMPAIILFVLLLQKQGNPQAHTKSFMWVCILALAIQQTTSRHRQPYVIADLPSGTVAVASLKAEKLTWLAQRTRPNDFLFEPGWPASYLPLQVRNPAFIDGFDSRGITPPEYVEWSIRQLDAKAVRYVLWSPSLELAIVQKDDSGNHLAAFRAYLEQRYRRVRTFSDADQLWERNIGR